MFFFFAILINDQAKDLVIERYLVSFIILQVLSNVLRVVITDHFNLSGYQIYDIFYRNFDCEHCFGHLHVIEEKVQRHWSSLQQDFIERFPSGRYIFRLKTCGASFGLSEENQDFSQNLSQESLRFIQLYLITGGHTMHLLIERLLLTTDFEPKPFLSSISRKVGLQMHVSSTEGRHKKKHKKGQKGNNKITIFVPMVRSC